MMEQVWFLNAISKSAFETQMLLQSFLEQQEKLQQAATASRETDAQSAFLQAELGRSSQSFTALQNSLAQGLALLATAQQTLGGEPHGNI